MVLTVFYVCCWPLWIKTFLFWLPPPLTAHHLRWFKWFLEPTAVQASRQPVPFTASRPGSSLRSPCRCWWCPEGCTGCGSHGGLSPRRGGRSGPPRPSACSPTCSRGSSHNSEHVESSRITIKDSKLVQAVQVSVTVLPVFGNRVDFTGLQQEANHLGMSWKHTHTHIRYTNTLTRITHQHTDDDFLFYLQQLPHAEPSWSHSPSAPCPWRTTQTWMSRSPNVRHRVKKGRQR